MRLRYAVGLKKQNRTSAENWSQEAAAKNKALTMSMNHAWVKKEKNSAEVKQVPENILGQLKIVLAY